MFLIIVKTFRVHRRSSAGRLLRLHPTYIADSEGILLAVGTLYAPVLQLDVEISGFWRAVHGERTFFENLYSPLAVLWA